MTNLLPLDVQKHVWHRHLARFLLAISCAIGGLAALFALALIPSFLALSRAAPTADTRQLASTTQSEMTTVSRAQALMSHLSPVLFSTSTPASVAIGAAISDMPDGVTLHEIGYTPDAKGGALLTLSGAAVREKVAAYRKTLSEDPLFSNVSVPVGALVGSDDGTFTVTLSVAGIF